MGDVPFSISDTKTQSEPLPKSGRVNEVCREWLVREDGALAYRLQSQEINEHYSGNKHRNAQVREDFPCALDEQIREQQLAEQAAAVYHRMLAEQEEIDNKLAQELAEKLEREERAKRRAIELRDEEIARQMLEKERVKQALPREPKHQSPQKPVMYNQMPENYPSPHRPDSANYYANVPRRQGYPMPLPNSNVIQSSRDMLQVNRDVLQTSRDIFQTNREINLVERPTSSAFREVNPVPKEYPHVVSDQNSGIPDPTGLYSEPYRSYENLQDQFDRIDIAEVGLPLDELTERQIQEAKDAELARQLQEQESCSEESRINRDRMMAIEAQDKELAKLLQERERAKVKRARERAKQKALAKKQLQQQQQQLQEQNQIMPDDAYSYPADVIPPRPDHVNYSEVVTAQKCSTQTGSHEDDISYSFPVDVLPRNAYDTKYSPQKSYDGRYGLEIRMPSSNSPGSSGYPSLGSDKANNGESHPAVRPTQLDLRSPINRPAKFKYPEPDICESTNTSHQTTSPSQHINIAMAIDPTYSRRGIQSPPSYETTSSTVTTSTSSSSPALPPPDISEHEGDTSPVPPYMPIQGQRRTASLEKKKKKAKDGCKQQ